MNQALRTAKTHTTRAWMAALLLALLAACSMTGDNPNPTPGPGPQPEPPTGASALVIEAVNSPVYDELAKRVTMVLYDGSQKAADHDLVIFDGDAHSPEQIKDHALVTEALQTGKWILGLDLSSEHKKDGLGARIGFATEDKSGAYMVSARPGEHGRTVYRIIGDAPPKTIAGNLPDPAEVDANGLKPGNAAAYADTVAKILREGDTLAPASGLQTQDAPSPDTPIPQGLTHQQWVYTFVGDGSITGSGNKSSGTQNYSFLVNYTFTVFLQNNYTPQFQIVLVQIDGEANPTAGTGNFVSMQKDEKAWFQDRVHLEFSPDDESAFTWVANDPQTPNGQTTYTASSGFNIGFDGAGAQGSYSWSNSSTYTIDDWVVTSNGSDNNMSWDFKSANPDVDKGYGSCEWRSCGFGGTDYPVDPNALSKSQLQFHASVAYKTTSLLTGWENFNKDGYLHLVDIYCKTPMGPASCDSNGLWNTHPQNITGGSFAINMGTVLPIPIKAVVFSENPAVAGDSVTGTVTLESGAQVDTVIQLSSNSGNATVPSTVTVPQGDISADFQVLTNANGLSQGDSTTATITATSNKDYQVQLKVTNSGPGSLTAPSTAPSIVPTDYAACGGNAGEWAPGYQVRYAVTFTTDAGESARGPWTDWTNNDPHMLPVLHDIPTDATGQATGRKVYRQFQSDYNSSNPSKGVTLTGTLNDNTTTDLADTDAAGTPSVACVPAPTEAPTYDSQNWQACVGTNGEWVAGYQVRYAVTFIDDSGETDRGPWSDWIAGGDYAKPTLMDIPVGPNSVLQRNIYRQFMVDYNNDPDSGIKQVGTLNDNTTTRFADPDDAGTTTFGC